MKNISVAILLMLPAVALAMEGPRYVEMSGLLKIYGKEKPSDELSGFSLFINGEAAKELYGEIKSDPEYNWCLDDGTVTKWAGNFECSMTKEENYSCSVGLGIEDQRIYRGESC
ncbi:hypothetical protein [Microbulbifer elongatus]|uniref:hypothetical protein n=1 Tax=Microbulbifer elongatus TaxID=86173 RepID=UPI001CFD0922|nr:hypothetical protein [Microbulbifer elongatus]